MTHKINPRWPIAFSAVLATAVLCNGGESTGDAVAARIETFTIQTDAPNNKTVPVAVRLPAGFTRQRADDARILVTFGGRNWSPERILAQYGFDGFADRNNIVLVAPGFVDDDYWQPEAWSGAALLSALTRLRNTHHIPDRPVFLYGYSAGGQCVNLFYAWMPERVEAWAAHACGVWFDPEKNFLNSPKKNNVLPAKSPGTRQPAPALITCGEDDQPRHVLGRQFVYAYRDAGGEAIWKSYPGGHELIPAPCRLTEAFFVSILENPEDNPLFAGDDDTGAILPFLSRKADSIPVELRSIFRNENTARLWETRRERE